MTDVSASAYGNSTFVLRDLRDLLTVIVEGLPDHVSMVVDLLRISQHLVFTP